MTTNERKIPKAFYDVHLHAYNLSHPGLLLFISRFLKNHQLTIGRLISKAYYKLIWELIGNKTKQWIFAIAIFLVLIIAASLFCPVKYCFHGTIGALVLITIGFAFYLLRKNGLKFILNVLSIFENEEVMQLLYLEMDYMQLNKPILQKVKEFTNQCRKEKKLLDVAKLQDFIKEEWESAGQGFEFDDETYQKVIITPLVMDFSSKGFDDLADIPYNFPPQKTVVNQAIDLFRGIQQYHVYSKFHLLEIIPFLGIKPKDLKLESIQTLLDRYFKEFEKRDTPIMRYERIMEMKDKCFGKTDEKYIPLDREKFFFAGVKIYPPLNVDPWPDEDKSNKNQCERKKIQLIYDYCIDKRIPITTHCSDGGFKVMDQDTHNKFTSPARWKEALDYNVGSDTNSRLTLNFGHSGIQVNAKKNVNGWADWIEIILDIIKKDDDYPNVYMDISDIGGDKVSYTHYVSVIKNYIDNLSSEEERQKLNKLLNQRILFGTDHMVNLFHMK